MLEQEHVKLSLSLSLSLSVSIDCPDPGVPIPRWLDEPDRDAAIGLYPENFSSAILGSIVDPEKSYIRRFRMKTVGIHCFRNYVLNFYQFRIQISIQFILSRSLFGPQ